LQVAQMNLQIIEDVMPKNVNDPKVYNAKGMPMIKKNIGILDTKI
jgi:hypothetical protein